MARYFYGFVAGYSAQLTADAFNAGAYWAAAAFAIIGLTCAWHGAADNA